MKTIYKSWRTKTWAKPIHRFYSFYYFVPLKAILFALWRKYRLKISQSKHFAQKNFTTPNRLIHLLL